MTSDAEAAAARFIADRHAPGLSLAVIRADGRMEAAACGLSHATTGIAVTVRTVFEAASLSKPVVAYAALRLIDMGRLALDEKLCAHVASPASDDPRIAEITVRHVLTHTTGLPNWRRDKGSLKTSFPPGERFSYSGEGFVYLQRVIERITGEPLDVVAGRLVLAPLGMDDSSFVWQSRFDADHAAPHDGALQPGAKFRPSEANAAYSLHTTAADFARFLRAVLSGEGLRPSTAQLWLQPHVHVPQGRSEDLDPAAGEVDPRVAWGLGWGLEPDAGTFFHWGSNDGFKAFALGHRASGTALVYFANGDEGLTDASRLTGLVLDGDRPSLAWLGYPSA